VSINYFNVSLPEAKEYLARQELRTAKKNPRLCAMHKSRVRLMRLLRKLGQKTQCSTGHLPLKRCSSLRAKPVNHGQYILFQFVLVLWEKSVAEGNM
jgi:hypothetical protein